VPGPGNPPILSETGAGVTADPFGNAVLAGGLAIYGAAGQKIFLGLAGTLAELQFRSGAAFELAPAQIVSGLLGAGAAQLMAMILQGPQASVAGAEDWVEIELVSNNAGGTNVAQALFVYVDNAQVRHLIAAFTNNALVLVNQSPAPGAAGGQVALFGDGGNLGYVSGADGSTYVSGHLSLTSPGQLVNSVTPATVSGLSVTVQPGSYLVQGAVYYIGNQAAGAPSFQLSGPAASAIMVPFHFFVVGGAGGVTSSPWQAFGADATGPTLAAGGNGTTFEFSGRITFTSGGIFTLTARTSIAADTYNIQPKAFMNISPC
jgi:hypothetical protein